MTGGPVSVVVVSRHRTAALLRCLAALRQQDHPAMEVVVVADPEAVAAVRALGWALKLAEFDEANISAARNIGLRVAGGDVVAFIDDDSVAEPTWVSRLAAPFADPAVAQATGFVRGRNGISYQWRAAEVDATGQDHPMRVPETASLHRGDGQRTVKTVGTNCAFRRADLLAAGGFDPAFRFYLDEADLNLRLAAKGGLTAVVPGAEVHHGFAASVRRRADRSPLTLHDIGASSALFLRRHAPGGMPGALDRLRHAQRVRLSRLMVGGAIEPRDLRRLLRSLEAGIADGLMRDLATPAPIRDAAVVFLPLPGTGPRAGVVIAGRRRHAAALMARTRAACADGRIVTLMTLAPTMRRHRMRFDPAGFWWQSGGLFGASDRTDPPARFWRMADRVARETARIAGVRPVSG